MFGDENNAFFHRMWSINRRKNLIKKIRDTNGIVQTQAFPLQTVIKTLGELLIDINLNWMLISPSLHSQLCGPFEENEIKNTIMSFNNGKALGLTVWQCSSIKKHWQLLKLDIMTVLQDFHRNCIINNNVNNTYIALIRKRDKCLAPLDYRPISLTTSLYKIIAKTSLIGSKPPS